MMTRAPIDALREGRLAAAAATLSASQPRQPRAKVRIPVGRAGRDLFIYSGADGFDLQDELDFLSHRALEPNVFFSAKFLAPAMPRLEDRQVHLVLMRDDDGSRSRMRMMMPITIDKPGLGIGASIARVWSNPFGPLGTPLIDTEDAAETVENLLEALGSPQARLAPVLVIPDMRLNGIVGQMMRAVALGRNLPIAVANSFDRPTLHSDEDAAAYLKENLSPAHLREMRRQWRLLNEKGTVAYNVARQPHEVHRRMEEFLALEARGWKGRKRTALVLDRHHAAFAREAVSNLAAVDGVRIHTIDLNGRAIASMVVLMMGGEAYTWKTTFDEDFARFSPGKLLLGELTEWHLDDPNVLHTDSCGESNHPLMSRFWREREEMGTLVIGLSQNADRDVRQVAAQLHMYRSTRNLAKMLRNKILSMAGRS